MVDEEITPRDYEQLVKDLVETLSATQGATTISIEHDVRLWGRLTQHQVDVYWVFEHKGTQHRIIFECRRYRTPLKQKDAFAWVGVVRDLAEAGLITTGVMVTVTGYQKGAQAVANGHGIHIMELRRPTEEDWKNRVRRIILDITIRTPDITQVGFDFAPVDKVPGEVYEEEQIGASLDKLFIRTATFERSVQDVMLSDTMTRVGTPALGMRPVRYDFDPPAQLVYEGRVVAAISALHGIAGEIEQTVQQTISPVDEMLIWMARNTLTGQRAWIQSDKSVTRTDS